MDIGTSTWMLLLLLISVIYGLTETYTKKALGLSASASWGSWALISAAIAGAALSWTYYGYPLPCLFLLIYLIHAARLSSGGTKGSKVLFLLNLSFANSIALHLVLIAIAALSRGITMYALLTQPVWRAMSVFSALTICMLQDICFFSQPRFVVHFVALSDSEEAKPFMAFLCFCAGYLLIDSTLCVFELEPFYPPLFLIGSSAMVMFALIRFLLHIYALMKNHHVKKEHDQLAAQLETAQKKADILHQLAQRDALTGVLSRRYILEHINALIGARTPFALAFMDLDGLKKVNDLQGHDAGDAYLVGFARALTAQLRENDLLARLGGDEFVVVMPGCTAQTADKRLRAIRDGLEFRFSFGVSAFPSHINDAQLLLQEADQAMYQDKLRRRREGALK